MKASDRTKKIWSYLRSRRLFGILTNPYLLVTAVFVAICIYDHNGYATLQRNRKEIRKQQETIGNYRRSISSVEARIKSLSTDKDTLEAFAREEYYYHLDSEDVFIVAED